MKSKYIQAFMKCAEAFAECSEANRLKVGCIFVKDGAIVASGLNGTAPGYHTNQCEDEAGNTIPQVLHAEQQAILKLARNGFSAKDSTVFITHCPCISCAIQLSSIGVKMVYFKHHYKSVEGIDWLQSQGIKVIKYE